MAEAEVVDVDKATENANLKDKVDFLITLMVGVCIVVGVGFVSVIITTTLMLIQMFHP